MVCVWLGLRSAVYITAGWEGRGAQPTSKLCDPNNPETTQLTRPLMTRK